MKLPAETHVAIVDGERFLLMRNSGTTVDPVLEFQGEPTVEDTNRSAGVRHQDIADNASAEPLDKLAHAAGVAGWLNNQVLQREIESLLIVADPNTLGEMRKHYHKETQAVLLGELGKQVTNLPAPQIVKVIAAA